MTKQEREENNSSKYVQLLSIPSLGATSSYVCPGITKFDLQTA
jgi:hypothetical protein